MLCDRLEARWECSEEHSPGPVCSLCWLYESEWGKLNREKVDRLISAVEGETGEPFRRRTDGRLWGGCDADRILGAIAVISRIAMIRGRTLGGG